MNELTFAILLFLAVALLIVGATLLWHQATADRRALRQRLDVQAGTAGPMAPTLMLELGDTAFEQLVGRWSPVAKLQASLAQAFPDMTLQRFLAIVAGSAVGSLLLVGVLTGSVVVAVVAGFVGLYVPFVVLTNRRSRRQRLLELQLPDALDFLSRSLRAGHSFPVGLQMMGEELPQPLAGEFAKAYDQHSLGTPVDDALKTMIARIESSDFAFFVTAVLIQRQTGGDLAQVLDNIGGMIRSRIQLQQQVKAKTAEGRFTGYVLAGFPAAMFVLMYLMSPDYASVLTSSTTGLMMLGASLGMSVLGLIVIQKLTKVRI